MLCEYVDNGSPTAIYHPRPHNTKTMAAVAQQYQEEALDEQQGENMEVRWFRDLFYCPSPSSLVFVMADDQLVAAQ